MSVLVVAYANSLPSGARTIILYTLSAIQLGCAVLVFLRMDGVSLRREFGLRSSVASFRLRAILGGTTWFLVMGMYFALTTRSGLFPSGIGAVWQLVYFIFLIALPEELIFRGIIMRALAGQIRIAMLASAALFSLLHLNNGLPMLPYYFALGLLLSMLRRSGLTIAELTIWHAMFNFVSVVALPAEGFRVSATSFNVVAPIFLLFMTSFVGWISSESTVPDEDELVEPEKPVQRDGKALAAT
ncbi:MAG: CPBP family intramembrane metalloprotease [Rhizobiaceae bacterium]|nr:CPBP family intramembrane metalloprotease [Rhizobiaceae bacterium]